MPAKVKPLIIFILSLCVANTQAQYIYIDKFYDSGLSTWQNEGIWGNSLFEFDDGYMFTSFTKYNANNVSGIWLIKTDLNGDTLWTKAQIDTTYQEFPTNMINATDGNYLIVSLAVKLNMPNQSQQGDACLTKITNNGEIIWKKYYGSDTLYENGNNVIQTNDGGYAIIASRGFSSQSDAYLVKTDSAGNQEWEQLYGGGGYEAGKSVVQTPDNGFMLLGWTRSFGNGQRDWYLVKTDSVGNEEWYKTYGDANNQSGWQIITLNDDNYLMAGGGGNDSARVIKVDEIGEVIWEKDYSYPGSSGNYIHSVSELPDYSIISTGLTNNSSQSDAGWLLKTDSAGNELWQRRYNKSNGPDLFYALLPTSDGGFLLGGQAGNTATNNNQDAWLLKVDSLGCTFPNCVTGIDEAGSKKVLVDVYPNPASTVLNIALQENKDYDLILTDLQGKVVYHAILNQQLSDIDVSGFADGIYLLTLENEEQRTTVKVVVQH